MRITIPCLLVTPVLWYLTHSPTHEMSHVLGTCRVGGSATEIKLIPSFWQGEFGRAWITPQGPEATWQQLVMTSSPYVLDRLSVAVGFVALHRGHRIRPFARGVAFMLLCLRRAFDVVCETVAFALGGGGDLYHIARATGYPTVWSGIAILFGLALFTIAPVLAASASWDERAAT